MNNMPKSLEPCASVHRQFEQAAEAHTGRVALIYGDLTLTYGALNMRANYLASYLRSVQVEPGDVVALHMTRSPDMVVAMLAVLKCGAAYLPIDASNPVKRITDCLDQASCKVVISDGDVDKQVLLGRREVSATRCRDLFTSTLSDFGSYPSSRHDRCYIMFSSGTTGEPKGIVVPHRAVIRLAVNSSFVSISPNDRVLQFAPPSFDAATFEFWAPLLNGAAVVLYPGAVFDPNLFKRQMIENQISVLWLTAALFHLVTDAFIDALRGARVLLAGGDVLNVNNVAKVLNEVDGLTLINGYGPTENTTFTCCHVMTRDNIPTGTVPIGREISGTTIHLLDEQQQPVEPGRTAELYASGDGVALGYLKRSRDDEKFFRSADIAPGLIYRTGDIVRQNEEGDIEFVGRRDNQIKLRGFRVSIEEIKSNLTSVEGVADAIVTRQAFDSGDQVLTAYVRPQSGVSLTPEFIRSELQSEVPAYMIPDRVVIKLSLPINQNGKLDRKSLSETDRLEEEFA